jgi:hypothetical protein
MSQITYDCWNWKQHCMEVSHMMKKGWNKKGYEGVSDSCGKFEPFTCWKMQIDDAKYERP